MEVLQRNSASWKYADRVRSLIDGTRLLGLRPAEWSDVELLGDDLEIIRIRNGKFASQVMEYGPFEGRLWARANGEFRELILASEGRDKLRQIVVDAIAGERALPWAEHDRSIRRTHSWAVAEVVDAGEITLAFGKRVTLYSYRHSVAADAKAQLDLFAGEVAGLMGHRSERTAVRSYARRSSSSGSLRVRPTDATVERVVTRDPNLFEIVERELQRSPTTGPSRG